MSASYSGNNAAKAGKIVNILKARFGEIPWWPGDTEEVMIGAILTQQTRWENVEWALQLLKERNLCSMAALNTADIPAIEAAVRCTGFYRIKTRRLKALAAFVVETCGRPAWMALPTATLREGLARGKGDRRGDCGQHSLLRVWPSQFCYRCVYGTHRPVCRDYHTPLCTENSFRERA